MKDNKKTANLKPAMEWAKTAVILLTVGFVGGYFYATNMATQNQAKLDQAVKAVKATVQVSPAASKIR